MIAPPDDLARLKTLLAEDPKAQAVYKERAATECVNDHARRYGLRQLLVRGTEKVLSVLLLVAVTHNLLRWIALSG